MSSYNKFELKIFLNLTVFVNPNLLPSAQRTCSNRFVNDAQTPPNKTFYCHKKLMWFFHLQAMLVVKQKHCKCTQISRVILPCSNKKTDSSHSLSARFQILNRERGENAQKCTFYVETKLKISVHNAHVLHSIEKAVILQIRHEPCQNVGVNVFCLSSITYSIYQCTSYWQFFYG